MPTQLRGPRLVEAYLGRSPKISPFFDGSPFALADFREKWQELQRRFGRAERQGAATALRPTSSRAAERLRRFVEEGGAVVTTGQQAGLFTGPLYTIYKILTAVRLADALEADLGILVLPVFWSASEDHDWEEVNHTYVVGHDHELHRLAISSSDPRPLPMSERILENDLESTLAALAQAVANEAHAADYLKLLGERYRPGTTVAKAFQQTVEALFAPFDLLVADAADPALKQLSVGVLARSVEEMAEHEQCFGAQAEAVRRAGFHIQVAPIPGAANLFFHSEHGRERIHRVRKRWITRESGRAFDTSELLRRIAEEPQRFSPNVALRPVVESGVFPTLAYAAGPGEISYFAQLRTLFAAHGMRMPLVCPRSSAVLVPHHVLALLEELEISLDDLVAPRHVLMTRLARERLPTAVDTALTELRRTVVEGYARLLEASSVIEPTLVGPLGASRNRALRDLAGSEQRILREIKRCEVLLGRQVDRLVAYLHPTGAAQDRVLNVFPFLAAEGPGLLQRLASAVTPPWHPAPSSDVLERRPTD